MSITNRCFAFVRHGVGPLEFDMEDASTWELVKISEFKVEDMNNYYYMTFTSNHTRAAIQEAVVENPDLQEVYEDITCFLVFCEDHTQASVVGADDNETADLHLSTSWFDRTQKFRRIWQQEKPDSVADKFKIKALKMCGLPFTQAALKSHRDMFSIASLSDPVWERLEKLQHWYQDLEDPSVTQKKR